MEDTLSGLSTLSASCLTISHQECMKMHLFQIKDVHTLLWILQVEFVSHIAKAQIIQTHVTWHSLRAFKGAAGGKCGLCSPLCHFQYTDCPWQISLVGHANCLFCKQEYMLINEALKYTISDKVLVMGYEG